MKTSCFVVPVHPPKFAFLTKFLKTYNEHFNDDVIVVFSSKEDVITFKKANSELVFESCVYDKVVSNVITEKKFHGLKYAFSKGYDFVACVDVECEFLKSVNLTSSFERWFSRKKFYASLSDEKEVAKIMQIPTKFFAEHSEKLRQLTFDYKAYFWFNDVPVYERDTFSRCLSTIEYDKLSTKQKLQKYDWDYLLYAYFLLLNADFSLDLIQINNNTVKAPYGFLENQGFESSDVFAKALTLIRPMWVKDYDPSFPDEIFMRFHLDRNNRV